MLRKKINQIIQHGWFNLNYLAIQYHPTQFWMVNHLQANWDWTNSWLEWSPVLTTALQYSDCNTVWGRNGHTQIPIYNFENKGSLEHNTKKMEYVGNYKDSILRKQAKMRYPLIKLRPMLTDVFVWASFNIWLMINWYSQTTFVVNTSTRSTCNNS